MIRRCVLVTPILLLAAALSMHALAQDVFEKPVRLKADGEVIDSGRTAWAHSSPCVEDIDGDGLLDLIVGDFSGKFQVYKNVGKPNEPVYHDVGKLQAGDNDASVRIYCCIGAQARFLDLDGDGVRDFLSNSYDPGHCFFFRGLPNRKFAAGEELVDKAGIPVRSAPNQRQTFESFGSFFTPVDWDVDGDIDLLIGCFDGSLKLRINEGDSKHALFATENQTIDAGGEPIKVKGHCCPVVADWDGDGLWDLVVSSVDGSVTWFRNVGSKTEPRFEKGVTLVEKCNGNEFGRVRWSDDDIAPGVRAQIEVVDYNGDGKPDLLLGDFCAYYEPRENLGGEEQTLLKKLIADMQANGKAFHDKRESLQKDFETRYPGDAVYSDEATAEWSKAYQALRESPERKNMEEQEKKLASQIRPLLARTHGEGDDRYDLVIFHGYVWLFIRK